MEKKEGTGSKSAKKTKLVKGIQYVIPLAGTGWVVKYSHAKKFTSICNSRREAIEIARSLAERYGRGLAVFAKDGSVGQRAGL